jgi:hypothetical protein
VYSSRAAVDAVLTEALDAETIPAPEQINRVTYLLVNQVGLKLAVARRVSQWITPQLMFLAETAATGWHQAEQAEGFIGVNGLLAAFQATVAEPAPAADPVTAELEPETEAEVTAETDIFCRFEFEDGGLCGGDALPDSPYCHSHQHAELPAPEVVAPVPSARPARRFRLGKAAPCLTPAV